MQRFSPSNSIIKREKVSASLGLNQKSTMLSKVNSSLASQRSVNPYFDANSDAVFEKFSASALKSQQRSARTLSSEPHDTFRLNGGDSRNKREMAVAKHNSLMSFLKDKLKQTDS